MSVESSTQGLKELWAALRSCAPSFRWLVGPSSRLAWRTCGNTEARPVSDGAAEVGWGRGLRTWGSGSFPGDADAVGSEAAGGALPTRAAQVPPASSEPVGQVNERGCAVGEDVVTRPPLAARPLGNVTQKGGSGKHEFVGDEGPAGVVLRRTR